MIISIGENVETVSAIKRGVYLTRFETEEKQTNWQKL